MAQLTECSGLGGAFKMPELRLAVEKSVGGTSGKLPDPDCWELTFSIPSGTLQPVVAALVLVFPVKKDGHWCGFLSRLKSCTWEVLVDLGYPSHFALCVQRCGLPVILYTWSEIGLVFVDFLCFIKL